jgi:hypothetical protein
MPPAESLCQRELTGIMARFGQSLLTIRIQCGLKVRVASDLGKSLWLVIRFQHYILQEMFPSSQVKS